MATINNNSTSLEPIALIGITCELAGDIHSPNDLWDAFKKVVIYFMSNQQWKTFEPNFFGLSDAEPANIDPCHRLLMLKFVDLLDDAGYSVEKVNGTKTSVHIGQFSTDHVIAAARIRPEHRIKIL
ncbi:unnamed protein product [Adineta steineri]|uniref:Beta-ketoacyl synthase-like N-terminal domain-containing protein n=1 Tax=Adineta steineri TaxID=433720 RepID=A0A819P1R7_9BILA|nr:unnamed protein product [Adineta steineri]